MAAKQSELLTNNPNNQVILTWTGHKKQIISNIQILFEEESHFDCILWADGLALECHRLVLSSYSPFLSQIIKEHTGDRPFITLDGISKEELKAIVEYMYTGETSISREQLEQFLDSCKFLEIIGLKEYIVVTSEERDVSGFDIAVAVEVDEDPKVELSGIEIDTEYDDVITDSKLTLDSQTDDIQMSDDHIETGPEEVFLNLSSTSNQPKTIHKLVNYSEKKLPSERYKCPKCGNTYSHKRTLIHHLHWICNQPATYSCSLCSYMGKRKFQLKSHMAHMHFNKTSMSR